MSVYVVIGVTVLIAAFVQGATGLGFALISGPVIGMVAPRLLPVFLLIQMIPLNGYVTWRERHAVDGAGTTWISLGRSSERSAASECCSSLPSSSSAC